MFGRVEDDLHCTAEIVLGLPEDADFEAPLGGKLEEAEPLVVRRLGGIKPFDIARIDVHRVHGGISIIEPEGCVVAGWRAVRRASRVGIGFEWVVGAFVVAALAVATSIKKNQTQTNLDRRQLVAARLGFGVTGYTLEHALLGDRIVWLPTAST